MSVEGAGRRPARRRGVRFLRDLVVVIVVAVLASTLIKTFLIESFFIPSPSMENTLQGDPGHHDRILVDRLVPSLVPLRRGDVIVFTDPGGWLGPETSGAAGGSSSPLQGALRAIDPFGADSDDHLVKRVIGLPGDRVACCTARGRMTVDGTPLDESYVHLPPGSTAVSKDPFSVVVKAGTLWVMGDNRDDSSDSRYQQDTPSKGFVPIGDVTGRAFVVSWPVARWSWLSDHPEVFQRVDAPTGG